MRKKVFITVLIAFFLTLAALAVLYFHGHGVPVLAPHGAVAKKERNLMIMGVLLGAFVVIPVYVLTFFIAWKYRESNKHAKHTPDWDHSRVLEFFWWAIPLVIISILSVVAWNSSHALDPFRSLPGNKKSLDVQVVALDWKWLFIYPEQHIASVNVVQFPVGTPVTFHITADAPMNAFWIPALGSQMYAMPGMSTQVHLVADSAGSYSGSSSNISGNGFAGMHFTATASSQAEFEAWVRLAQHAPTKLDMAAYKQLAMPSQNNAPAYYSSPEAGLYDTIVMKYMMPMPAANHSPATPKSAPVAPMPGMDMSNMQGMGM